MGQNNLKTMFPIALIAVLICLAGITADPKPEPKPNPKDIHIHIHGLGAAGSGGPVVDGESEGEGNRFGGNWHYPPYQQYGSYGYNRHPCFIINCINQTPIKG